MTLSDLLQHLRTSSVLRNFHDKYPEDLTRLDGDISQRPLLQLPRSAEERKGWRCEIVLEGDQLRLNGHWAYCKRERISNHNLPHLRIIPLEYDLRTYLLSSKEFNQVSHSSITPSLAWLPGIAKSHVRLIRSLRNQSVMQLGPDRRRQRTHVGNVPQKILEMDPGILAGRQLLPGDEAGELLQLPPSLVPPVSLAGNGSASA